MDFRNQTPGSYRSSVSSEICTNGNQYTGATTTGTNDDSKHSSCESIAKARSNIHLLAMLLPDAETDTGDPNPISSLADSVRPARSLLSSIAAYEAISSSLSKSPSSGAGDDPICHWLYDTFISSDSALRLVVLSYIPLLAGIYLSRIHCRSSPPLSVAGFEAVLLGIYSSETKSRAGKPILISIPDLSQSSLYHSPSVSNDENPSTAKFNFNPQPQPSQPLVAVVSPTLEPQTVIKSTKRATIVGVALDCYYKQISQMPDGSKLDFCKFAADWAGQNCPCKSEFDKKPETPLISDGISTNEIETERNASESMKNLKINDGNSENVAARGTRIPLPWELLQPILRILGHFLLAPLNANDVRDAASIAVRSLYARSSHDLVPQAILATRSLIHLDNRAREAAARSHINTKTSKAKTPSKGKKPEIHLAS